MEHENEKALVLAAGGVAGIAWELGVLLGLLEGGVDVRDAALIVGTSAGSSVGALVAAGVPLELLYAEQLQPAEDTGATKVEYDRQTIPNALAQVNWTAPPTQQEIRAQLGKLALAAPTMPEAEWRAFIASRLPLPGWPLRRLLITAVDAESGEPIAFDRDSGVPIVDAVAASCAVPLIWPPVTINNHRYMDGGARSLSNADLAAGYGRVLIVSPSPVERENPVLGDLKQEIATLKNGGSHVFIVTADEQSQTAMGSNVLDPSTRQPAAAAGHEQGRRMADDLREFWR